MKLAQYIDDSRDAAAAPVGTLARLVDINETRLFVKTHSVGEWRRAGRNGRPLMSQPLVGNLDMIGAQLLACWEVEDVDGARGLAVAEDEEQAQRLGLAHLPGDTVVARRVPFTVGAREQALRGSGFVCRLEVAPC